MTGKLQLMDCFDCDKHCVSRQEEEKEGVQIQICLLNNFHFGPSFTPPLLSDGKEKNATEIFLYYSSKLPQQNSTAAACSFAKLRKWRYSDYRIEGEQFRPTILAG